MNNTVKWVTALSAGVLVGAVAGVLFAPEKGSEFRRKIGEKGKKFAEDLKEFADQGKKNFTEKKCA